MTQSLPASPQGWPIPLPKFPASQRPTHPSRWKAFRRWGQLSCDLGLDLGTSNTRIYVPERGIVIQEPSAVALDTETRSPAAYGTEALRLMGRTPSHIQVCHPVRVGNVANLERTEQMLRHWMEQAQHGLRLFRPRVMVSVPSSATGIDRDALVSIVLGAGARQVFLIDQPVAAALGAGLSIDKTVGHLLVDVGGGTTDVTVMSLWGTVISQSIPVAGEVLTQTIQQYIRRVHHLQIGRPTAERLKLQLSETIGTEVAGLEVAGLPIGADQFQHRVIERAELREALKQPLTAIVQLIRQVLEQTPPELVADICDRGILLTGGGSLLGAIEQHMSQEMGLLVHRVPDPFNAVALGAGYALKNRASCDRLLTIES